MNKPPTHGLYARLTEEQRAQLHDWILVLGYAKTKERIALPEPEGFAINTHFSSLHRFYLRYAAEQDAGHVGEANQWDQPAISELFPLAEQAAHAGALRLTTAPLDPSRFGELSRWVSTQQAQELKRHYLRLAERNSTIAQRKANLAESRLELDREKFRFNAARQALIHFAALAKIAKNRGTDSEAKIKAAADLLFPSPSAHPAASAEFSSSPLSNPNPPNP